MLLNRTHLSVLTSVLLLSGCQWHNKAALTLDQNQIERAITYQQAQSHAASQPIPQGPLTLANAIARGLIYNADYHAQSAQLTEEAQKAARGPFQLYPQLFANGSFTFRANEDASVAARVTPTALPRSTEHFTASDEGRGMAALEATWNILDLGLSAMDRHITKLDNHNKHADWRQASRRLTTDITRAFWRLDAYHRHHARTKTLGAKIERTLAQARNESKNDDKRTEMLFFIREITDLYRYMLALERTLNDAPANFNHLLNLPQHLPLSIKAEPAKALDLGPTPQKWVETALLNRPEMANAQRNLLKEKANGQREIIALLPSIMAFINLRFDSNSYALNGNWLEAGMRGSWNALRLLDAPKIRMKTEEKIRHQKRLMESTAALLARQSAIAFIVQQDTGKEMDFAITALDTQNKIVDEFRRKVRRKEQPERFLVKEEIFLALAAIRHDLARADYEAAKARVIETHGLTQNIDPQTQSLEIITASLSKAHKS